MIKRFLIIVSALSVLGGCAQKDTSSNRPELSSVNCENANNISSETAILIGKGMTLFDYDLRRCDVRVDDKGNNWKVEFTPKKDDKHQTGNCPTIWVSKKNGEIVNGAFPK